MTTVDLHMHSRYSDDGEFSPDQLMQRCAAAGVRVAAIADHNCVRAIPEGLKAAQAHGVELIPATELDCTAGQINLHVLGYWIDPEHPGFASIEENILSQERAAARARMELVRAQGIAVDEKQAFALSPEGIITGEIIAEVALALQENDGNPLLAPYRAGGARADNPFVNFYWDFCAQGKPAYIEIKFPTVEEAVRQIQAAGGVAVLAHPGNNIHEDEAVLDQIVAAGVCGVEAYSSYHTAQQTAFYVEAARRRGLAITCGSDFHGKTKPAIALGGIDCGGEEQAMLKGLRQKRA